MRWRVDVGYFGEAACAAIDVYPDGNLNEEKAEAEVWRIANERLVWLSSERTRILDSAVAAIKKIKGGA